VRDIVYTDGVKYVAETAGAYWLIDEIALAQRGDRRVAAEGFQSWILNVNADRTATLTCEDGDGGAVLQLGLAGSLIGQNEAMASRSGQPMRIVSCYEAGFDGHWLHRWLTQQGVVNHDLIRRALFPRRRHRPRAAWGNRHRLGTDFICNVIAAV
jgi:hypothetical protein